MGFEILKNQRLICTRQELFLEGIGPGPGVTLILPLFLCFPHKKVSIIIIIAEKSSFFAEIK